MKIPPTTILFVAVLATSSDNLLGAFFPSIARSYGVDVGQVVLLSAAFQIGAFTLPFLGPVSDRIGRRPVITGSLLVFATGSVLAYFSSSFWMLLLARVVAGLGFWTLGPALNGFIGDYYPFERRGRVTGTTRLAFQLPGIVGVPFVGLLVQTQGIHPFFLVIAALGLVAAGLSLALPQTERPDLTTTGVRGHPKIHRGSYLGPYREVIKAPGAKTAVVATCLWALAPAATFGFLAAWLEARFGLTPAQIGWVWVSISLAGLTGAALARWLSDRVGKKAFSFRMLMLMTVALALLPYSPNLIVAVGLSFLMTVGLEAGWVSFLALVSEIAPSARGTLLSAMSFGAGGASLATSVSGRFLWAVGGYPLMAGLGALGGLVATLLVGFALPQFGKPKAPATVNTEAVKCSPESMS
jgi:MFS family permease